MERIHAVTFAPFCARGTFEKEETRQSLKLMKEKTGANYVIFAPKGVQKTAFSENIDYRTTVVATFIMAVLRPWLMAPVRAA